LENTLKGLVFEVYENNRKTKYDTECDIVEDTISTVFEGRW